MRKFHYLLVLFSMLLVYCSSDDELDLDKINYEDYANKNLEIRALMSLDSLNTKVLRIDFDYKNLPDGCQIGVGYFLNDEKGKQVREYQSNYSYQLINKSVAFALEDDAFENEDYTIIPFIKVFSLYKDYFNDNGNNIYEFKIKGEYYLKSDEIKLNSKFNYNVQIYEILPKSAFVGDTLIIKGRDFCNAGLVFSSSSKMEIAGEKHEVFFESDSLLKCVISSRISDLSKGLILSNCGMEIPYNGNFQIKKAVIDSVSYGSFDRREIYSIYGDNFVPESFINGLSRVVLRNKNSGILYYNINSQDVSGSKKQLNIPLKDMIISYGDFDILLYHLNETIEVNDALTITNKPLDPSLYFESIDEPLSIKIGDTLSFKGTGITEFYKEAWFLDKGLRTLVVSDTLLSLVTEGWWNSYSDPENDDIHALRIYGYNGAVKIIDVELLQPRISNVSKSSVDYNDVLSIEVEDLSNGSSVYVNNSSVPMSIVSSEGSKSTIEVSVKSFEGNNEDNFKIKIGNQLTGYDEVLIGYNLPIITEVTYFENQEAYLIKGKNLLRYGGFRVYINGVELLQDNFHFFYKYDDEILMKLKTDEEDFKISLEINNSLTNEYQL